MSNAGDLFWGWILNDCVVRLKKELGNNWLVFTSTTKCEIKQFVKKMYTKGWWAWKTFFCWSKPVAFFAVLVAVTIAVAQYIEAGFLPCFLAPVKKQHHNTTTEQQNFDTSAPQPSEEEYFYPTIEERCILRIIYTQFYNINTCKIMSLKIHVCSQFYTWYHVRLVQIMEIMTINSAPHIWVVLVIGWIKFPTRHDQSEALPRSG